MTLQSRKKHPTTVPNTKLGATVRRTVEFGLAFFLILGSQQAAGQTQAQQVGWSSRGAKSWPAPDSQTSAPITDSSRNLPWRRSSEVAGQSAQPAATALQSRTGFSAPIQPATQAPEASNGSELAVEPIRIHRIKPADYGSAIESVRQYMAARQHDQNFATARDYHPPARTSVDPFDDPFGDRANANSSGTFSNPFGSGAAPLQMSADANAYGTEDGDTTNGPQQLVSLTPFEEDVSPTANESTTTNRNIAPATPIRLHNPGTEFDRKNRSKLALTFHSALSSPIPSMSPQLLPQNEPRDETLGDVPEFPEYSSGPEEPPTPDEIPGADDMDELPDLEEPPTPEGFESNAREEDEELPDPDGDEDDDDEDLDLDDDDDEQDDEDDDPDCGRTYNDRDCCEQDEICRNAWDRLNEISINDIEVSISPPLAPLAEDDVEIEEQRERLQESPFRDFKNRFGSVVASGTIDDYKDGDVLIRTEDGGSVPVPFEDLGYDERCFVSAWWGIPTECLIRPGQVATRDWTKTTFTWKASSVCHKSLFFEDVQLERYGHSAGPVLQPLISGAHFFASVGLFPYSAGIYPATECHYVLGYYRPGECAPWVVPAFPLSRRGAAMETAGLLGFFGVF